MKKILKKMNSKWFLLFLFTFFSLGMQAQIDEGGTNNDGMEDIIDDHTADDYAPLDEVPPEGFGDTDYLLGDVNISANGDDNDTSNPFMDFPEGDDLDFPDDEPLDFPEPDSNTEPKSDLPPDACMKICVDYSELDRSQCKCVAIPRPWYPDNDGDDWHNKDLPIINAIDSPGPNYKNKTLGTDCDDNDITVKDNCYKNYYIDNDGDDWDSGTINAINDNGGKYKLTTLGTDCDDNPTTGANVHKLNKCGKCEAEPVNGSCDDRDCIENNTNNPSNIKPSEAKLSQNAIDLLKAIETLSLIPYDDATGKPTTKYVKGATIGYGHLITSAAEFEKYKNGISESSANTLFTNDIDREIKNVRTLSYDLSQNQFDALAIMVFNIGTQFNSSSLRKFLQDCNANTNYNSVEDAWKAFNKDNGILLQGLINRRNCEWDIFVNGIYKQW